MIQRSPSRPRTMIWGVIGTLAVLGLLLLEAHAFRDVVVLIETY